MQANKQTVSISILQDEINNEKDLNRLSNSRVKHEDHEFILLLFLVKAGRKK